METPQTLVCTPVIVRYWCIVHGSARFCQRSTRLGSAHLSMHCVEDALRAVSAKCSAAHFWAELLADREKWLDNSAWGSREALKSFPGR